MHGTSSGMSPLFYFEMIPPMSTLQKKNKIGVIYYPDSFHWVSVIGFYSSVSNSFVRLPDPHSFFSGLRGSFFPGDVMVMSRDVNSCLLSLALRYCTFLSLNALWIGVWFLCLYFVKLFSIISLNGQFLCWLGLNWYNKACISWLIFVFMSIFQL